MGSNSTHHTGVEGRFFKAGSSASIKAWLEKRGELALITLEDVSGNQPQKFSASIVAISDRLASVSRKITLEDGSVFEARDSERIDEMFATKANFFGRLSRVESSFKLVTLIAVCTVLLLVGTYRYGLPALANGAARITPSGVLTLMDKGTLSTVDFSLFSKSKLEEGRRKEIAGIFKELATQSGQSNPPLQLLFRDGGRLGANAIALPGGTIVITDQLIAEAKSDDEIAGVLGHEIGHVELRHSLRQIYRVLGIGFMISVIGGDSGQLVEDVIGQAVALESLSYTRSFETESDYRSAELMVGLERDPFAFIELLKRITNDKGDKSNTGWLSTHPGTFDRTATIKEYINTLDEK